MLCICSLSFWNTLQLSYNTIFFLLLEQRNLFACELITAKQIKVLLAKNETLLFSDPALDLTDDVTSMLDVAASEADTQSE